LVFQGVAIGPTLFSFWVPVAIPGALNRNQFCEAVLENTTGDPRAGWAVLVTGDNQQISATGAGGFNHGYVLTVVPSGGVFNLARSLNSLQTTLDNTLAIPADGTTVALTAEIEPAQTVLKVFLNGVLSLTINDNNVARLTTGLPGIFGRQNLVTSMEFGHLRCGVLTRL